MEETPEQPSYRALPKREDGQIDRELVRHQFMTCRSLSIRGFAEEMGYNRSNLSSKMPWKRWRAEKIADSLQAADEEHEERAVGIRASFITNQLNAMDKLPKVLFGLHRLLEYMVTKHQNDLTADLQDQMSGRDKDKGWVKRFSCSTEELVDLTKAGVNLTEAIHRAVGLNTDQPTIALSIIQNLQSVAQAAAENAEGSTRQVTIKGMGVIDPKTVVEALRTLYDAPRQAPATVALPEPEKPILEEPGRAGDEIYSTPEGDGEGSGDAEE